MASIKLILYILILVAITVLAALFIFRNDALVTVDFFLFKAEIFSVGFWVVLSFLFGSFLGWMISLPGWLGLRLTNRRRNRQLQNKEDELLRLKGETTK